MSNSKYVQNLFYFKKFMWWIGLHQNEFLFRCCRVYVTDMDNLSLHLVPAIRNTFKIFIQADVHCMYLHFFLILCYLFLLWWFFLIRFDFSNIYKLLMALYRIVVFIETSLRVKEIQIKFFPFKYSHWYFGLFF